MENKKPTALLIDGHNTFMRAYAVDPSLSTNGDPIGGVKGFLKILQRELRDLNVERVIVVWDGPGGSRKRRLINNQYKQGRKPVSLSKNLNRHSEGFTDDQKKENVAWQMSKVMEYLNEFPVIQLMMEDVEADDVIAYLTGASSLNGWNKIVYSNDKDFLQLCNESVRVYRPIKREMRDVDNILEEHGIHPTNFAMARAIVGDTSDNLPGIKRVGLKTVKSCFEFLGEEKTYTFSDIKQYCMYTKSKKQAYKNILENFDLVEQNYKIMQLYSPMMSIQTKNKIDYALNNAAYELNFTNLLVKMSKDGFGHWNWDTLKQKMRYIVKSNRVSTN